MESKELAERGEGGAALQQVLAESRQEAQQYGGDEEADLARAIQLSMYQLSMHSSNIYWY